MTSSMQVKRFRHVWPLPTYLLISLVMTWPLAIELGTQFPSDTGSDMLVHEWTLHWLKQALLNLQNPFFTHLMDYPTGVSLTSHNIAWANFGLWLPLTYVWGQAAATSLTYLLIFTFNAYAMYLFAYGQTRSQAGAWIAGLIFGFFPTTLSDGGHINMLPVGWLPLALLYLDRAIKAPGWRNACLAGLFLALLGITRWQLLAIGAIPAAIFVVFRLFSYRSRVNWHTFARLIASGGVAVLIMAPFLAPVVIAQVTRSHADDLIVYEPAFSSDLLGYFVPHFRLLAWHWLTQLLPGGLQFPQQEIAFFGYAALLLAACALVLRWRASLVWLVVAGVLIVLAMGPVVTIGGTKYDWIYTPYRLIEDTFYNQFIRKPWRYNAYLGLPLAMLGAIGVAALRTYARRMGTGALVAVLSLLILAEYGMAPYPLMAADMTPAWYKQLANDPDQFAVLGMPISSRFADKFYMYYQMEHGKPIVGGHVSRQPRESIDYMVDSPFLNDMFYRREMDPALVDVTHQLRYLADANVRYLILHKNFVSAEKIKAWKDWLTITPVFEDGYTVVYRTAPTAGVDFKIEEQLTPALGVISAHSEPEDVEQGQPLSFDIRWAAAAAPGADYDYCMNLIAPDGAVAQQECVPISPDWSTSRWQANEVARSAHTFRADPFLPQAEYRVTVTLRDSQTGAQAGQPIEFDSVQVNAQPRVFTPPAPQHPTKVRFGPAIQLQGYDLVQDGETAKLALYWGTDRRLDRSYKVFVHAVDSATGEMLAQYDAAPRNWAYPTTWWEAGEFVTDPIELALPNASGRNIQLQVGLYDEQTGERLVIDPGAEGSATGGDSLSIPLP
jgi:hypothetical protein